MFRLTAHQKQQRDGRQKRRLFDARAAATQVGLDLQP
jgi:hypothetical protein